MASDQAKALLQDPSFWQKPDAERIQAISSIDQDFAKFSPEDQTKALKLSEPKYRGTAAPPKRDQGMGKPKQSESLEQGLSREGPIMRTLFTPVTGALEVKRGVQQVADAPTMRGKAQGATRVLRGGLEMASPYAAEGLVAAPLKTFLTLAGGTAAGEITETGAKSVGIPDEYAELVGTGASILAGGKIAKGMAGRAKGKATVAREPEKPPSMPVRPPPLPETPRPPQENWKVTGQDYLRQHGTEAQPRAQESAGVFQEAGNTYTELFDEANRIADSKKITGQQYVQERLTTEPPPAQQSAEVFKKHGPTHAENFEKAIQRENVRDFKSGEQSEKARKAKETKTKEPTPAKESAQTFKKAGPTYTELFDKALKKTTVTGDEYVKARSEKGKPPAKESAATFGKARTYTELFDEAISREEAKGKPAATEKYTVGTPEPPKAEPKAAPVAESPAAEAPKKARQEPWQMTRERWNYHDKQIKYSYITKALSEGKKVSLNTSDGKTVEIAKPSDLKIDQAGAIRTKDGRLLTNSQVDKMATQAGMKVPEAGDKPMHRVIVENAVKAGKQVPADVLKQYPSLIETEPPPQSSQQKSLAALRGGAVKEMTVGDIDVDPKRFQFKSKAIGKGGTSEELRGTETFDPEKAGIISVWKDPANGKTYVINGHHRLELAKSAGYEGKLLTQELKAKTPAEARLKGALINIAEGRGEAVDAAKVFRDSKLTPEQIKKLGVPPNSNLYKQGVALSKLSDPIFEMVSTGGLAEGKGAAIGEVLDNPAQQKAAVEMLERAEKRGKHITDGEFKEALRLKIKRAPLEVRTTENLFGTTEEERSLALELGEVSEYVKGQLRSEKRLFGTVGNEGAAKRLGETGNVIKPEENQAKATETSQVQEIYDRLSGSSGPVSEALDQAAKELGSGQSAAEVKSRAYDKIRDALQRELSGLVGGGKGAASRGVPPASRNRSNQSSGRSMTATPPG